MRPVTWTPREPDRGRAPLAGPDQGGGDERSGPRPVDATLVTSADVERPREPSPATSLLRRVSAFVAKLGRGPAWRPGDLRVVPRPPGVERRPGEPGARSVGGGLVHHSGERARQLGERQVLGRAATCDLVLEDVQASREHAVIWWTDGKWMLRDLNSLNGTYVEGRRLLPSETRVLVRGDRITFGAGAETWVLAWDGPPRGEGGCTGERERD